MPLVSRKRMDTALAFELANDDRRDILTAKLVEYTHTSSPNASSDTCASGGGAFNTSLITVYGINGDDASRMFVRQYWPCAMMPTSRNGNVELSNELRGFDKVYVQFYRAPVAERASIVDEFRMEFSLKTVRKVYKKLGKRATRVSSRTFMPNSDMRNYQIDLEFEAPAHNRATFILQAFSTGHRRHQSPAKEEEQACTSYIVIRTNRTIATGRYTLDTLPNTKYCYSLGKPPIYLSSFDNRLSVTMVFGELALADSSNSSSSSTIKPEFEFTFGSEPVCNNVYITRQLSLISYSTLQSPSTPSFGDSASATCNNVINSSTKTRRIVVYRVNWATASANSDNLDMNGDDNDDHDHNDDAADMLSATRFVNGRLACRNAHHMLISEQNPKYERYHRAAGTAADSSLNDAYNTYCVDNPFNAYVSTSSLVLMSYRRTSPQAPYG